MRIKNIYKIENFPNYKIINGEKLYGITKDIKLGSSIDVIFDLIDSKKIVTSIQEVETKEDLEKKRNKEIIQLNIEFDSVIDEYYSEYSRAERETFTQQHDEAVYKHGKTKAAKKETYLIRKIAKNKGIALDILVKKIKTKSEAANEYFAKQKQIFDEKKAKINDRYNTLISKL